MEIGRALGEEGDRQRSRQKERTGEKSQRETPIDKERYGEKVH